MNWLLLELLNEDDEEEDHTCPFKTMLDALIRRKIGKEININPLIRILFGKHITLPDNGTIVTPYEKMMLLVKWLREAKGHPQVREDDGSRMKFRDMPFENWGLTVKTK